MEVYNLRCSTVFNLASLEAGKRDSPTVGTVPTL